MATTFKALIASKTFWFNVIMTVLDILAMPEIVNFLPAHLLPWLVITQGFGNILLRRFFTTQPIGGFFHK